MSQKTKSQITTSEISAPEFYEVLFNRRDVRGQFTGELIDPEALARVLYSAHHAPSVGFMQPWNFLMVHDLETRQQIHGLFEQAQCEATAMFPDHQQQQYKKLKLEGIIESSVNVCITCDRDRAGPVVLGRTHIKEMDLFSTVCAVQNFWLAARAEGLGVGWVSIFDQDALKKILNIPDDIVPIAYLCVGPVSQFNAEPDLQSAGWCKRTDLTDLVYHETWQGEVVVGDERSTELIDAIKRQSDFPKRFQREG